MFHKAIDLKFSEGTSLEITFQTGEVKKYDISVLFGKYPALTALQNRNLFVSGRLMGAYGIIWNDELDLEAETVYEDGETVSHIAVPENIDIGNTVIKARAAAGMSQKELSSITGIDQSDISKIERGTANPCVTTLKRMANAFGKQLNISFE